MTVELSDVITNKFWYTAVTEVAESLLNRDSRTPVTVNGVSGFVKIWLSEDTRKFFLGCVIDQTSSEIGLNYKA